MQSTMIDEVLNTLEKIAHTGKIGDGKLFVHALSDVVRVRTGERDEQALG